MSIIFKNRSPDVYYEFSPRNFQSFYEILLIESDFDNPTHQLLSCEIELPFGEFTPESVFTFMQ